MFVIFKFIAFVLLGLFLYGIIGNVLSRCYRMAVLQLVNEKRNLFTYLFYPVKSFRSMTSQEQIRAAVMASTVRDHSGELPNRPVDFLSEFQFVSVDEVVSNSTQKDSSLRIGIDTASVEQMWHEHKMVMSFLWPLRVVLITLPQHIAFVTSSPFVIVYKLFKGTDTIVSFIFKLPHTLLYIPAFFKHIFAKRIKDKEDETNHPYRRHIFRK